MKLSCASQGRYDEWPGKFEELFPECPYCKFQFDHWTFTYDVDNATYAVFWTIDCPSCKKEIEGYQNVTIEYTAKEKE